MKEYLVRYFKLYYRNLENGQWYPWDTRQSSLHHAESEARHLIDSKNAVAVKAVELLLGRGWQHEQEKEVILARVCGGNIEVTTGRELSEKEMWEIASPYYLEMERQRELDRSRGFGRGR